MPLAFPFPFYITIFQFKRGLCLHAPPKITSAFYLSRASSQLQNCSGAIGGIVPQRIPLSIERTPR